MAPGGFGSTAGPAGPAGLPTSVVHESTKPAGMLRKNTVFRQRRCQDLEARGIVLEVPYRRSSSGIGYAFLTDPWGVSIALTEGLRGL